MYILIYTFFIFFIFTYILYIINTEKYPEKYTNIIYSNNYNLHNKYKIQDLTNIIDDQCKNHYDNRIVPYEKDRCNIKFLDNHKNVSKHNNNYICLSACTYDYRDRISILYNLLKYINTFLNNKKVEWCLYYGALIGMYTRKELLPWDPDIDIIINIKDIYKLKNHSNSDYDFNIDPNKINIHGKSEDIIGRFIDKQSGLYADITFYFTDNNNVYIKKIPTKLNKDNYLTIPQNKFYPIKLEYFNNGINAPVPSDVLYNLSKRYNKFKDHYILKNTKYVKIN